MHACVSGRHRMQERNSTRALSPSGFAWHPVPPGFKATSRTFNPACRLAFRAASDAGAFLHACMYRARNVRSDRWGCGLASRSLCILACKLAPRIATEAKQIACVRSLLQVPRRVLGDFSLSPLGSSAPSCLRNPTCMHARVSRLEWPSDAGALLHARVVPLRFALSDGVQDTSGPPFSQLPSHPFMQACASDCHRRQSAVACVRSRPQVSHWVMGHFVSANPACMPAYRAATRGRIIVACMHRARKKSLCLWRCFLAHPGLH